MTTPREPTNTSHSDPGNSFEERLAAALEEYTSRLQAGEEVDREAFLAAHPSVASVLRSSLAGLEFVHQRDRTDSQEVLGDFRILRELGRGGMGVVYEAEQISLGRKVALKVLRHGAIGDDEVLQRFRREVEAAAQLHHTHIVPVYAVGEENGVHYFAMQLIDGRDLSDVHLEALEASTQLTEVTIASWGVQAAEALAHAHDRGIVHRDVKPSNLLLDREHRLWLADFGLARRMDDVTLSVSGRLMGTPLYMSPEQARAARNQIDARTDIYSLGASLYELATGSPVFDAETAHEMISAIVAREPTPPRVRRPGLSRDFETILLKCLEKEPKDRYPDAQQVADDFRAIVEDRPVRARRPTPLQRGLRWIRAQRRGVTLGTTVATVALVIALLWWVVSLVVDEGAKGTLRILGGGDVAYVVAHGMETDTAFGPLAVIEAHSVEVDAGSYTLEISGPDAHSDHWLVDVAPRRQTDIQVRLSEPTRVSYPSESVQLWPRRDGARLLHWSEDSLECTDLRGERLWQLPLARVGWVEDDRDQSGTDEENPFVERRGQGATVPMTPTGPLFECVQPGVDLNQDGDEDLILRCDWIAEVLVLSGRTGEPLLEPPRPEPLPYGWPGRAHVTLDASADTLTLATTWIAESHERVRLDKGAGFIASFGLAGEQQEQWVRGFPLPGVVRQGERPDDSPHEDQHLWSRGSRYSWGMSEAVYGPHGVFALGPTQTCAQTNGDVLLASLGTQVFVLDPTNGEDLSDPIELPIGTVTRPRVADLDGDGSEEFVSFSHRGFFDGVLEARSPLDGQVLWERHVSAHWGVGAIFQDLVPQWPLVVDVDDDGASEILVPDRRDLGERVPVGGLALLSGTDGTERWHTNIRTATGQVDRFCLGPDLDLDQVRDVWAVTYRPQDSGQIVTVDVLSGRTGEELHRTERTVGSAAPLSLSPIQTTSDAHVGPTHFWYSTSRLSSTSTSASWSVHEFRSGAAAQLRTSQLHLLDIDGDRVDDLLSIVRRSGQTTTSYRPGITGPHWRRQGVFHTVPDVDGDAVDDLLQLGLYSVQLFRGRSGALLWEEDELGRIASAVRLQRTGDDYDADGIPDLLFDCRDWGGDEDHFVATVSGRTGERIWRFDLGETTVADQSPLQIVDAERAGSSLGFLALSDAGNVSLICLSASTGELLRRSHLQSPTEGQSGHLADHTFPFALTAADLDADNVEEFAGTIAPQTWRGRRNTPLVDDIPRVFAADQTGSVRWIEERSQRGITRSLHAWDMDDDGASELVTLERRTGEDAKTEWLIRALDSSGRESMRWEIEAEENAAAELAIRGTRAYLLIPHYQTIDNTEVGLIAQLRAYGALDRRTFVRSPGPSHHGLVTPKVKPSSRPHGRLLAITDSLSQLHDGAPRSWAVVTNEPGVSLPQVLLIDGPELLALSQLDSELWRWSPGFSSGLEILGVQRIDGRQHAIVLTSRGTVHIVDLEARAEISRDVLGDLALAERGQTRGPSPFSVELLSGGDTSRCWLRYSKSDEIAVTQLGEPSANVALSRPDPWQLRLPWVLSRSKLINEARQYLVPALDGLPVVLLALLAFWLLWMRWKNQTTWLALGALAIGIGAPLVWGLIELRALSSPSRSTIDWMTQSAGTTLAAIPAIWLVAIIPLWLTTGRWFRLGLLAIMTLVASAVIATGTLLADDLPYNTTYSMEQWYILLGPGFYFASATLIAFNVARGGWRMIRSRGKLKAKLAHG